MESLMFSLGSDFQTLFSGDDDDQSAVVEHHVAGGSRERGTFGQGFIAVRGA